MRKLYIPIVEAINKYGIVYRVTKLEIKDDKPLIHIITPSGVRTFWLPDFYLDYVENNIEDYEEFQYGKDFKYLEFGYFSYNGNLYVEEVQGINEVEQDFRLKEIDLIKSYSEVLVPLKRFLSDLKQQFANSNKLCRFLPQQLEDYISRRFPLVDTEDYCKEK